ncbi:MAG: stage V sporulation protein D [Firmicutes bacterium]|nr:stage V sporulation protein D [Bacillota bacterium]
MSYSSAVVRKRIKWVFVILGAGLLVLAVRVAWIQFVQGDFLTQKALDNRLRDVAVESKRGTIYDRNRQELAVSISSDALYAIPPEVQQSGREREIAQKLAAILGMDENDIYEKLIKKSRHEWIKLKVPPEKAQEIKSLQLPGIDFAEKSQRFYPKDFLACHVLGISGIDNTGLEGIDYAYNQELSGVPGRIMIEYDALGRKIPQATHMYVPPQDGNSLVLTIDETIQYIAERELDKVFKARQPKAATIIVMDPNTGEVLAMASRPNFNPNSYSEFPAENRRNMAVSSAYEPGSIFKIVTASGALDEGVVTPQTPVYCSGGLTVGKHTIHCSGNRAHGSQTFTDAVAVSCNIGHATVGMRMGQEVFYKYLRAFGMGEKTGIDLPGEATGILVNQKNVKQIDLATMSIGQANALTPIQLMTAMCTVANGGNYIKPHLAKQVLGPDGSVIKEFQPEVMRQSISPQTSAEMRAILENVVAKGSGSNAQIDGYHVAGKTGTAQKIAPGGGYLPDEYLASFIGFAPADNPKVACLVMVDAPQGLPFYGGWVSAPVFKEVVRDTLRYMQVPYDYQPTSMITQSQPGGQDSQKNQVAVPKVVTLSVTEAERALQQVGLGVILEGQGEKVWGQTPTEDALVASGSKIVLYIGPKEIKGDNGQKVTVPDVTGQTIREAGLNLGALGLRLQANGSGIAAEQNPRPGTVVEPGTIVAVTFNPPG